MFPGSIELSARLAERAGVESTTIYREALRVHHWLWQWLRISDQPSLAFLRQILLEYELVEANPEAGWIVNRSADDYNSLFGGSFQNYQDKFLLEVLKGNTLHTEPFRIFDSGSGNCTAIYENARPWFRHVGSGFSLVFAVDGTLRNWLREPLRGKRIRGYQSGLLTSTLKLAEIWSIAHFVGAFGNKFAFDPIHELHSVVRNNVTSIEATTIEMTRETIDKTLQLINQHELDGNKLVSAISLGYLLDALASRVTMPNGMQFSYNQDGLHPTGIEALLWAVENIEEAIPSRETLLSSRIEVENLQKRVAGHLTQPELSPKSDQDVHSKLSYFGDLFRQVGFELRAQNGDMRLIEALYAFGNALWNWYFFLGDFDQWATTTSQPKRSAYSGRHIVRSWLERPWGILRIEDMFIALSESFNLKADTLRLLTPLGPLLREGVKAFVDNAFPNEPDMDDRLSGLIGHRCQLQDLREEIKWVSYGEDEEEMRMLANLLIELLTNWFYSQPPDLRRQISQDQLEPLRKAIVTADWLDGLNEAQRPMLSRRQRRLLSEYQSDTVRIAKELFEFEDDVSLVERLDVYPPEEFWLFPEDTSK